MQPPTHKPSVPADPSLAVRVIRWAGCLCLAGLGVGLALTNPKQEHYTEFATNTVSHFLVRDVCRSNNKATQLLDSFIQDGCAAFQRKGATEIRSFIEHNTERQDFIIFSLYTTEFPIRPLRVLGLFNQFFLIS